MMAHDYEERRKADLALLKRKETGEIAAFRRGLKRLPVEMADHPHQIHVDIALTKLKRGDLEVIWRNLKGAYFYRHRSRKILGYIDHEIEAHGERLRVIRLLFN